MPWRLADALLTFRRVNDTTEVVTWKKAPDRLTAKLLLNGLRLSTHPSFTSLLTGKAAETSPSSQT